ncbi:hypothetical protein BSZ35_02170 [Salinibacter sp. 10B]|uniref:TonB-dependent receptor plug domain-containing protein n=1 Tax=Salinibacter sp. 10B TaxID=1923971 RepID=UPI000CF38F63|nr:TonB-dependent receptor [Salinibacter sp. 10B]PQJ33560.1 hypothetical protein BSZ35_02170 [Salinibacter sp. 10B]
MAAVLYRTVLLLGILLAFCTSLTSAQSIAVDTVQVDTGRVEWERALPPLTVTASRIPTSPAKAPARVTVLDSTALARTGAASVADALEARAALYVRRYGAHGLATPALRGTGASQTALLLNGQSMSNPQLGHLDLSLLPTVLLRSVEVMHGPASPLHGSDGLGGAIHLHTLRPQSSVQVRGTLHAGAFGARGGSLLVGGPLSKSTSVLLAADYQSTDGDFPYLDEGHFPPQTVRRKNADRVQHSVFGSVESQGDTHRFRVSGWAGWSERGLPPASSTAPTHERQWDTQLRLWAEDRIPMGDGTLTLQGMTQHTRIRYTNPAQELDQTGRTWTHSLDATGRTPVTDHWTTVGGVSGSIAQAFHPRLDAPAHQERLSAFAEGTGRYSRLRLYPALRADTYWMPGGQTRMAFNPRLGLNWPPVPSWPTLRLKAQIGRAFRVPTFNDRYWEPGGNPDLRPERSWGGDLGLWIDHSRGHVELTTFGHRRQDQIVWRPTGNGYWAPVNVGRVRALGSELSGAWGWMPTPNTTLDVGFKYTFTDARNRSTPRSSSYNERVRYVPRDQMKVYSTVSWGPAALTINARYTGRRPLTSDGRQFLNAHVLTRTRLQLEHSLSDVRFALSVDIENVFDTDYRSIGNHPMPPRHAQFRLLIAP